MSVASTSIRSFQIAKAMGLVKSQKEHVFEIITESTGDICSADIVSLSGIKESSVTARVNALAKDGRVRKSGEKVGPFGVMVQTWQAVPSAPIQERML